jgi:hypothetical protein
MLLETTSRGETRLAQFTYVHRLNLLSMAREFAKLAVISLKQAVECLAETDTPIFDFLARRKSPNNQIQATR